MDRVELETTSSPTIKFEKIKGSLRLKGWDRPAFRADCDSEDAHTIEQTDDLLSITSTTGCMVRVPMESTLQVGEIAGDLMIKSAEGKITAESIRGQVMAKSVGPMEINEVRGQINARGIEGDFFCKEARGNVSLQDVEGSITIGHTKGNLVVKGYCAGLTAESNGNITLKLEDLFEGNIQVQSGGNIFCRLMPEASANFVLKSGANHIRIKQDGSPEIVASPEHEFRLGEGGPLVTLEAKGNVDLVIPGENEFDWEYEFSMGEDLAAMADDISQVVTEQLETQLDALGDHLSSLSDNLSSLNPEISEKTRARIEAKRAKLERKLAKVERRAAEKARQASRRVSRRYTVKPNDPVSDEERQKVLEMLQKKLISVQDAEALLAALEGTEK
jgi:hypothetical protein